MDAAGLTPLFLSLERYAGWLDRDRTSVLVRADVAALGAAIESGAETSRLFEALEIKIARLPSGGMRTMLRGAARKMRQAIDQVSDGDEES